MSVAVGRAEGARGGLLKAIPCTGSGAGLRCESVMSPAGSAVGGGRDSSPSTARLARSYAKVGLMLTVCSGVWGTGVLNLVGVEGQYNGRTTAKVAVSLGVRGDKG